MTLTLLAHAPINTNAIMSVSKPVFRRQPLMKSPMIHTLSAGIGSSDYIDFAGSGLVMSRNAESRVSGMTMDQ